MKGSAVRIRSSACRNRCKPTVFRRVGPGARTDVATLWQRPGGRSPAPWQGSIRVPHLDVTLCSGRGKMRAMPYKDPTKQRDYKREWQRANRRETQSNPEDPDG